MRWSSVLVVSLLVVLAACQRGNGQTPPAGRGPNGERPPAPVEVAVATLDTVSRSVRSTGSVEPIRTVVVNSQVAGALLTVNVEEGDRVARGEVMARIDTRELEAQPRQHRQGACTAGGCTCRSGQCFGELVSLLA